MLRLMKFGLSKNITIYISQGLKETFAKVMEVHRLFLYYGIYGKWSCMDCFCHKSYLQGKNEIECSYLDIAIGLIYGDKFKRIIKLRRVRSRPSSYSFKGDTKDAIRVDKSMRSSTDTHKLCC